MSAIQRSEHSRSGDQQGVLGMIQYPTLHDCCIHSQIYSIHAALIKEYQSAWLLEVHFLYTPPMMKSA